MKPPKQHRMVLFCESTSDVKKSSMSHFKNIIKKPFIFVSGKTCSNLKVKVFQKYCQLKTKIFTVGENIQKNLESNNMSKAIVNSKCNVRSNISEAPYSLYSKHSTNFPNEIKTNFRPNLPYNDSNTVKLTNKNIVSPVRLVSLSNNVSILSTKITNMGDTGVFKRPVKDNQNMCASDFKATVHRIGKTLVRTVDVSDSSNNISGVREENSMEELDNRFGQKMPNKSNFVELKTKVVLRKDETSVKPTVVSNTSPNNLIGKKDNDNKELDHPFVKKQQNKKEHSNVQSKLVTYDSCALTTTKLKIPPNAMKKIDMKHPIMKNIIKDMKESYKTNSTQDKTRKKHPNRRLQTEKPQSVLGLKKNSLQKSKLLMSRKNQPENPDKNAKAWENWVDVLKTPDLWIEERPYIDELNALDKKHFNMTDYESEIDYQGMLEDFVCESLEETVSPEGETHNEKRFREMLQEPDYKNVISKFYISPAQVEIFYQNLTENMTSQECLSQVCKTKKWPQPKYIKVQQPDCHEGFCFTCELQSKTFSPKSSALNENLARELAASTCLDWLGLTQRKTDNTCWQFTENTYF